VLYFLLTGIPVQRVPSRRPVAGRLEYVKRLIDRPFMAPAAVRSDVPPALSDICMKLLDRDPGRRYARAEDAFRDLEQRYLYAKGFGPTNNSLQAYLEIFDAQFKETSPEQLQQLPFLRGELQRPGPSGYTPQGRRLLEEVLNR